MKKKIFCILMILFFAILLCNISSSVFAVDHNITGSNFQNIDDVVDSANSGDRILLGDSTYTSSSSGSTISVTGNKNLTIQGQSNSNRATLNAKNLDSILYIQRGSSATIRYVNFLNSGGTGHALGAYGVVLIENCNFINSRGDSGAAIYVNETSTNTIIRNCNFTNNYANSPFENNYTAGGAICVNGADNVEIRSCYFTENMALNNGGALTIREDAKNNRVINCNFINNQANNGGAIFNQLSTTTISGCTFTNNKAVNNGGAIDSRSSLTISNSNFNNNNAKYGGAIYTSGNNVNVIKNSKFIVNIGKYGGAIYNNGLISIQSSTFKSNKGNAYGGAIYNSKNLNISGGSINKNSALYGSGVYNLGNLRISKVSIESNLAKILNIILKVPITVKPSKKFNIQAILNTGDNIAGAIYNKKGSTYINNVLMSTSSNAPSKTFTSVIDGKTKKIKSNSKGIATRTHLVSKKSGTKIKVTVSYSQGNIKWSKSVTVKVNSAIKKINIKKYVSKKKVSSKLSTSSSTTSNKAGKNVKFSFLGHEYAHLASLVNLDNYEVDSPKISYWNLKKNTSLNGVTDCIYKLDKTGWYSGTFNNKGGPVWKKLNAIPTSSGTWFNLYVNSKGKYTIGNKVSENTNNTAPEQFMYFVSVKSSINHGSLTPYIGYTYTLVNKKTGSKSTVRFFEKATTDIYFNSLGVTSKLKNELTYSDARIQVKHSDFKNIIIKIFQGKAGSGKGIEGELSADKKIRTIYKWIKGRMDYWGYYDSHYRSIDVLWRLQNRAKDHANCVDQSILLVTFLRTVGVPAYFEHNNAFGGHVVVKAYYTNKKKYTLDTTSSKNDVNVIKNWNPKNISLKSYPRYKASKFYVHLINKKNRVPCHLYKG